MRLAAWLLAGMAFASPVQAASTSTQPIESFTLKNGMQVIVLPNHRVPAVNHMLWYRIGAADDPRGKSGLAHYMEHLMFKGSPRHAAGEYVRLVSKNGGDHNAFTGRDATSYYVTIAKDRLPLAMELEADRMRGLTVSNAEALKEREVILEERRQRIDNLPESLLDEQMQAALFRNHPYHNPVIGWEHEMSGLTLADARAFHAQYYQPGNAVLIVSGDITAAELKPLAEKYYGSLPGKPVPPRHWLAEPPQRAARHVSLAHTQVKQPMLSRRYIAPSASDGMERAMPAYVLSHLLGGGKTSALYQSLVVKQKLAASVDVSYGFYAVGPASFDIEITPEKDVPLPVIEKALDDALAGFEKEGADAAALARAKRLMQAESVYAREGLTGTSNIMGWMVMAGVSPEEFNRWDDRAKAVTAAQIHEAAQAVLVPEASVTGYLLPKQATP